ncbi:alpha/beta fold hydrolase [Mycobacterium colombiense]|uniref:alpha/beta fold hydrolase n=1 Tax=Mycobacterium colombiense TaxID=339268 RepID=UPI002009F52B|nr:alpha/beta hydrolase [Mycobacterium colombiense]MCK8642362.1 alpha/beta hydrolase [Mycobacterium colombiense]
MANLSPFRGPRERAQFLTTYDSIMRSWPIPFEEQDAATTFGETHIIASGPPSAPPLVLLHGASATSAMWSPIIAALSGAYRCYCIDTITDANKSVATQPIRGITDYVDWLQQIYSALGIAKARVAGLSYGGWLAALLALHAPERVSHLVLLTPAATLAPLTTQFFVRILTPTFLRSRFLMRRSAQWLSATPNATRDPTVELVVLNFMSCRPFRREMMPPTVFTDDDLRRISMSVTVLIGDRDVIYRGGPEAALARGQEFIPNVRTQLLQGANHMLTLDCPDALITQMSGALA